MSVRLSKLTGGRHHWAEDAKKRGVLVPDPNYAPVADPKRGIREVVTHVPAKKDDDRLFERLVRVNGVVEWYEVRG